MILYIAEKPSLARAIAQAFPNPQKKADGCIWLHNGDCISWCIGHLLEQAEPHIYDSSFKQWRFEHLPIVPTQWQWQEKSQTRKQLSILRKLVKQADHIIHAGDPDREGQLLVDEVLHFFNVPAVKINRVERLLINDLTTEAIKKALKHGRPNSEFAALSRSALARARADWLYGLNMTRALTLKGQSSGYQGVLSVGRVQTPVLGLVVKRDAEIENFVEKDFFQVLAHILTPSGEQFTAKWQPSEACQPFMDSENRVLSQSLAENVARRIQQQPASVMKASYQTKHQSAPLPYSLSALQIDAAKAYSLSAQQVLDSSQNLYEKYQLITYPRSDSRHLPTQQFQDATTVLASISRNLPDWQHHIESAVTTRKSKAWNDKLVQAHHAIIPTDKSIDIARLTQSEQQIYRMICRQFIMQFYPDYQYLAAHIELNIVQGCFIAKGNTPKVLGWKALLSRPLSEKVTEDIETLPHVTVGETLLCERGQVIAKVTTPPPAYNDASLLAAMTGISRHVHQADIRAILRETDGLGTEATRAGIIELLFTRGFLMRENKLIRATATGKALIKCLPEAAVTPDMTAQWESALNKISLKELDYSTFMQQLIENLTQLVASTKTINLSALQQLPAPTKPVRKTRRRSASKSGSYKKKSIVSG